MKSNISSKDTKQWMIHKVTEHQTIMRVKKMLVFFNDYIFMDPISNFTDHLRVLESIEAQGS